MKVSALISGITLRLFWWLLAHRLPRGWTDGVLGAEVSQSAECAYLL